MIQIMTVEQKVERAFLSLGQPQNFEAGGTPLDSSFLKTLHIFPGATPEFWPSSLVILSPPFPHPLWAGPGSWVGGSGGCCHPDTAGHLRLLPDVSLTGLGRTVLVTGESGSYKWGKVGYHPLPLRDRASPVHSFCLGLFLIGAKAGSPILTHRKAAIW